MTPEEIQEKANWAVNQFRDTILCWIDGPALYARNAGPQRTYDTYEKWLKAATDHNPAFAYVVKNSWRLSEPVKRPEDVQPLFAEYYEGFYATQPVQQPLPGMGGSSMSKTELKKFIIDTVKDEFDL